MNSRRAKDLKRMARKNWELLPKVLRESFEPETIRLKLVELYQALPRPERGPWMQKCIRMLESGRPAILPRALTDAIRKKRAG